MWKSKNDSLREKNLLIYQYGSSGKRKKDELSYSEQLLQIHMRNDRNLYFFIQNNKKELLKMDKYNLVKSLKRNMSDSAKRLDGKHILARFVRKSFLIDEIRMK